MSSAIIHSAKGLQHTNLASILYIALHHAKGAVLQTGCPIPSALKTIQQLPCSSCKLGPAAGNWPSDVVKPHVENPPPTKPNNGPSAKTSPTQIQQKLIEKYSDLDIDTSQFRLAPCILGD